MKQHRKDIALAFVYTFLVYLFGVFFLGWIMPYITIISAAQFATLLILLFVFCVVGIVLFYFLLKRFTRQKLLFWCVALGCHLWFAFLSYWLIANLNKAQAIETGDVLSYLFSQTLTVCTMGVTLLLDAILLLVSSFQKRRQRPQADSRE